MGCDVVKKGNAQREYVVILLQQNTALPKVCEWKNSLMMQQIEGSAAATVTKSHTQPL